MSIYEIAKKAGVSVSSVSRVINNKDGVGKKTRKRILEIIEENNFYPSITKSTSDTIAIILNASKTLNPINSDYIHTVISGITDITFENDLNFMIIPFSRMLNNFNAFCLNHKIRSAIFINLTLNDKFLNTLDNKIPIAVIGNNTTREDIISVRSNNRQGAYDAMKHLIDMGHKKIAFYVSSLNHQDHIDRLTGYKEALEEHEIEFNSKYLVNYDYSHTITDLEIFIDNMFLTSLDKPTAIFACDDSEAFKIGSILTRKGLNVPDDVSLVGFDDYKLSKYFSPPLTTVRQPIVELGSTATKSLIDAVNNGGKITQFKYVLDNHLIIRKSVKAL